MRCKKRLIEVVSVGKFSKGAQYELFKPLLLTKKMHKWYISSSQPVTHQLSVITGIFTRETHFKSLWFKRESFSDEQIYHSEKDCRNDVAVIAFGNVK